MSRSKLHDVQKKRMAGALQEALAKRQKWGLARIMDAGRETLDALRVSAEEANVRFEEALKARGLCAGDTVRVVLPGPHEGTETVIEEIECDGRLKTRIGEATVLPWPSEVELVIGPPSKVRRRK